MGKLFGTDGVRGVANQDLLPELAFKLGFIGASLLVPKGRKARIVVGKDTRLSGDLLESALTAGILSSGADVLKAGVCPTAGVAYLTRALGASGGVVISASHNPAIYNGIKFFDTSGFKLADGTEERIEGMLNGDSNLKRAHSDKLGRSIDAIGAIDNYINHLVSVIPGELDGFRVAIDCANGSAFNVAPVVFRQLGAEVLVFAADPNGTNINYNCGSTCPQYVQEIVQSHEVDLGLAYDGDADRVIAVDETGEVVDGDFIMAICAHHLKQQGDLAKNSLVTTVMTNMGFDLAMKKEGIRVIKTKVGDKYVLEEMRKEDIVLGGEQSGHIIFLDDTTTGDGIVTALKLVSAMRDTGQPLSELKKIMSRLPQVLLNVSVKNKDKLAEARKVWEKVKTKEQALAGRGRILVRSSGTEQLVRVMVESESEKEANFIASQIANVVEEELS